MTTAFALLKAFAAAFSVSPWLRTTVFVLVAFCFGFVKGCNTGRGWAKSPEPVKVERPERKPILPRRQTEAAPKLPPVIENATVPVVAKPEAAQPVIRNFRTTQSACANGSCSTFTRRRWFR